MEETLPQLSALSSDHVAILLSTKNGARFIHEQMVSILWQNHRRRQLFWRDDGSTDATLAIMRDDFELSPYNQGALGITQSYADLLRTAWDAGFQMFALADQDDVWAPDKLARAVEALANQPGPALYCARQSLVDERLRRIGASPPFRLPIGFPAALTQNIATGCTIVINRAAAHLIIETMQDQQFHDWWCYLIVSAAGGRVIADEREVMLYRQHTGNAIGAPRGYVQRALAAIHRGPNAFMAILRAHVAQLQTHAEHLTPQARDDLAIIADALQHGPMARWQALRLPGFRRQTYR